MPGDPGALILHLAPLSLKKVQMFFTYTLIECNKIMYTTLLEANRNTPNQFVVFQNEQTTHDGGTDGYSE